MPTALPIATDLTTAATQALEKIALTAVRAALAEMGDPMGRAGAIQNLSLVFTVGASALTCNAKTRAGLAPSALDPVSAAMRNVTLATDDFNVRNITAALSLVISSGSTLGHANATASRIYWYLIDNAGALELAASTKYFGPNGIVSTTAEGGAGTADSATVMYSTTARTNVPFICVSRTTDTQTTAGTWTAVPTSSELWPFDLFADTVNLTGGQIAFPATQIPSSNANTLDDYEEGTFTPTGIGQTFSAATGFYTKIGRLVHVSLNLTWSVNGAGNQAGAGSLPFAVVSSSAPCSVGTFNSAKLPMGLFVTGTSRIDFYQYAAGGPTMLDSDLSNSTINCGGCYYTT